MRWLARLSLLVGIVLLSSSATPAQEKGLDSPYYPLQVGNVWSYKTSDGNKFQLKITAHEKVAGDMPCARVVLLTDNREKDYELIGVNSEGIVRYAFSNVKPDKPVLLLKLPPKAGDTWTVDSKALGEVIKGTFKVTEEEVKVPAGTFKTFAVRTDDLDANGLKITATSYYASGTGLVKQEIKIGNNTTVVELEKFEPAKK